jgi:hypothetical protein
VPEIVDLYGRRGFGAIAITDHLCESKNMIGRFSHGLNYSLTKENFSQYMEVLHREARRSWEMYSMILIPGFEVTKNSFQNHRSAHILVLGTREFIDPELSVDEILTTAKNQGAITVAAHPFHTGDFEFQTFHLWSRREQLKPLIDLWEVNSRQRISSDVLESGLPIVANSDFHRLEHFKSWKTKVLSERNSESVFTALKTQKIDFFLDS